jgi:hypothetical protein
VQELAKKYSLASIRICAKTHFSRTFEKRRFSAGTLLPPFEPGRRRHSLRNFQWQRRTGAHSLRLPDDFR